MAREPGWAAFFEIHEARLVDAGLVSDPASEVDFLLRALALDGPGRVLDVGCGTGRYAIALAERGLTVTGLDLSPHLLEVAAHRAEEAGVELTLVRADPAFFDVGSAFDAVVCLCEGTLGLLEPDSDPVGDPLSALRNIAQALKPGGRCVVTALNGLSLIRRHTPNAVTLGTFDPTTLSERSGCWVPGESGPSSLRERGFVPTELRLMCQLVGLRVLHVWGGSPGRWGRRPVELDEEVVMLIAERMETPHVA